MSLEITHTIICDLKSCGKRLPLLSPPADPFPGIENTVSTRDALGSELFFCCPLHMVKYWVEFIKATPEPPKEKPKSTIVVPTESQMEKLLKMGVIEKDAIPPPPEDMNLR
jgi:hypothetical protein